MLLFLLVSTWYLQPEGKVFTLADSQNIIYRSHHIMIAVSSNAK